MIKIKQQSGAVLITSLMMLVAITILAISSINSSTVNLHIVNNMQSMREVEDVAQDTINQIISGVGNFNIVANRAGSTTTIDDKEIVIADRVCLQANVSAGNSQQGVNRITQSTPPPDMTVWDVEATVTDNISNASVTVHQGIKIQLPSGQCL